MDFPLSSNCSSPSTLISRPGDWWGIPGAALKVSNTRNPCTFVARAALPAGGFGSTSVA